MSMNGVDMRDLWDSLLKTQRNISREIPTASIIVLTPVVLCKHVMDSCVPAEDGLLDLDRGAESR